MPDQIDTMNAQLVGRQGDTITVAFPHRSMTTEAALCHAAWLVMCADYGDTERFMKIFEAIKGT